MTKHPSLKAVRHGIKEASTLNLEASRRLARDVEKLVETRLNEMKYAPTWTLLVVQVPRKQRVRSMSRMAKLTDTPILDVVAMETAGEFRFDRMTFERASTLRLELEYWGCSVLVYLPE